MGGENQKPSDSISNNLKWLDIANFTFETKKNYFTEHRTDRVFPKNYFSLKYKSLISEKLLWERTLK